MGIESFQIIYDNSSAIFMPGQSLSGKVIIVVKKSTKVRSKLIILVKKLCCNIFCEYLIIYQFFKGIKMTIKGRASVSWSKKELTKYHYKYYRAKEEYFNNQLTLVGDKGTK